MTAPPSSTSLESPITRTKLERRLAAIGQDLLRSLERVIINVPGQPDRPQLLARTLGLKKDLSSRLLTALRKHDPLAAIHALPGPAPLRQLVSAAAAHGVNPAIIDEASQSIDVFDEFIRTEFEARTGLDALISASIPDARSRYESSAKQAIFRGFAGVRGISVDTLLVTFFLCPSTTQPSHCDTVVVNAFYGLRRLRPGAQFEFSTVFVGREERESDLPEPVIQEFCSPSPLPIQHQTKGDWVYYHLDGATIGHRHAVDLVTSEHYAANHPIDINESDTPNRWFYATVEHPAKVLLFDFFVHHDVWPSIDPDLVIYDTTCDGVADPNDPIRNNDRLDIAEQLITLDRGSSMFRSADVPRYIDLLEHVTSKHGWSLDAFRGYRARIAYPIYGSQVCLLFPRPDRPDTP